MNITLKEITVRELSEDYQDNNELGVRGYGGKLDIRPPYQREFVYKDHQRDAVINTVRREFPLNVMYWSIQGDGGFEVIDGQQRTISICQYVTDAFSINGLGFCNLKNDQQDQILNYKLMIYLCEGTDSEKLEWFRTINIAGEKLYPQELRNAVYSGPWTADAKRYFSKNGCPAYGLASGYLNGYLNRQEFLETAIDWHARAEGLASIEDYLSKHQHDPNASALWLYFQSVIGWVQATFPNYRREMKGLDWGGLYNAYKASGPFDTVKLEKRVAALMMDDEVQKKSGIYYYVLDGDERHMNLRAFTDSQKREAYELQKGKCPICKKKFEIEAMEGDHIKPWREGGKTVPENCQMLCLADNRIKGSR